MLHRLVPGAVALGFAGSCWGAAALAQTAYITNSGASPGSVAAISTVSFATKLITVGAGPTGVAASPNGSNVYVSNGSADTVSVISTATNTVTATIPVGKRPFGLAVNFSGSKLYVANRGSTSPPIAGTVSVIVTSTNTVVATIDPRGTIDPSFPLGAQPSGVAVTPDGSKVYLAQQNNLTSNSNVAVIDAGANTLTKKIPITGSPLGIAVTPNGSRVYTALFTGGGVAVIDTATDTVTTGITTSSAYGIAISLDSSKVYASDYVSNTVKVIDTGTNAVTTTIPVGTQPRGLALTPDGSTLYVANFTDATVSVVSTATNSVTATRPTGSNPEALGKFISSSSGPLLPPAVPGLSRLGQTVLALGLLAAGLVILGRGKAAFGTRSWS